MGLLDSLKSLLGSSKGAKVDVAKRFELMREAISGTMSSFYMARDRETGEVVGLKLLDIEKTAAVESRIKGVKKPPEGEIATNIVHARVVKTLSYGLTTTGQQYVVMEYLEGQGLNSLIIARSKLLNDRRLILIRQAAESIAAVHKAGYIHRDICPRNFVVAPDGKSLKLIDFGLTVPATPEFMQPGNRTGTPNYMAPELVRRKKTDQRLDVFSFGVTAYEICTFELPWGRGVATGKAALSHDTQEPTDIREHRPTINSQLATAITRCLNANPDQRTQSMEQFLSSIKGIEREDGE